METVKGQKELWGGRKGEDLGVWVNLPVKKYQTTELFLHGVSMGGSAVMLYAGRTKQLPAEIKGRICDSCYARYDETFMRVLYLAVGKRFLSWSLVRGASFSSAVFSGVRFGLINPVNYLNTIFLYQCFFFMARRIYLFQ